MDVFGFGRSLNLDLRVRVAAVAHSRLTMNTRCLSVTFAHDPNGPCTNAPSASGIDPGFRGAYDLSRPQSANDPRLRRAMNAAAASPQSSSIQEEGSGISSIGNGNTAPEFQPAVPGSEG